MGAAVLSKYGVGNSKNVLDEILEAMERTYDSKNNSWSSWETLENYSKYWQKMTTKGFTQHGQATSYKVLFNEKTLFLDSLLRLKQQRPGTSTREIL